MSLPLIAITMGDAAGVGPEIIIKLLSEIATWRLCRPVVIGDAATLRQAASALDAQVAVCEIGDPTQAGCDPQQIDVWRPAELRMAPARPGRLDPAHSEAVAACLREVARLAQAGRIQGALTAPMNKEGFHLAGYGYADELVYLSALTGAHETTIMGVMCGLWVDTVAEHIPFREIADLVTRPRVLWHIRQLDEALRRAHGAPQRLAVAALNVHGGEGGTIGREEVDEIAPAIADARAQGLRVEGPIPGDSVFPRALSGEFAGVLAMYHDQANIARKLQPMDQRATLFWGLPIPVGTTAHGTGYDIAGRGLADAGSLRCALQQVCALAASG